MITPTEITNYNRTLSQLQEFWLFCIIVAGKNSDFAASKLAQFLSKKGEETPFEYIRNHENYLHNMLVANRVGQYGRIEQAFKQSIELDLTSCTLEELENVYGVGPKTARFFLVHSRPAQRHVILDTHVLTWLRDRGVDTPKSTPSGEKYKHLERVAIALFESYFGKELDLADIDLLIWKTQSGRE